MSKDIFSQTNFPVLRQQLERKLSRLAVAPEQDNCQRSDLHDPVNGGGGECVNCIKNNLKNIFNLL